MDDLNNIETIRKIIGKLDAEKPAAEHTVGRTEHQGRTGNFLKKLTIEVAGNPEKARLLVTGQIGVGKSSELLYFFHQRKGKKSGFWVHCDLEKGAHPERCGATGVLLAILRDSWGSTKSLKERLRISDPVIRKKFSTIRDELIERLIDWLKGEKTPDGDILFRFGGMDFPVKMSHFGRDSALALILNKAAQHEAVSNRTERFGIVPDKLVNLMNELFKWLKEINYNIPPLIIIDHVDKIRDENAAKEVLVEIIPQWQRIEASIIMTAPFEFTLGDMRNSVESYWNQPLMIYPLEIPQLDDSPISDFYLKIVNSCGLSKFTNEEAIRLLAHYSGGIPRLFVQFLIQTVKEAHLSSHFQINISDAQSVIFAAQRAYQDYGPEQLDLLSKINNNQVGLGNAAILLRSPIGLLILPPEQGHLPVKIHPLAQTALYNYQKTKKSGGK